MPYLTIGKTRLFYRLDGAEPAPVIVFSHSIGTDHAMWDPQVRDLVSHFRILRLDARGHGASDTDAGDYSVDQLAQDVFDVADALNIRKFVFCGISLGGAIGQWLAIHRPERLTALILSNTSPRFGPPANWDARIEAVRRGGMAAICPQVMERFFSPESLARPNPYVPSIRSVLMGTNPVGYQGCCAALRDFDATLLLQEIKVATLLLVGDRDVSTPWEGHGSTLAEKIAGARVVRIPAAHLSNLEQPRTFNTALLEFLGTRQEWEEDSLQAGLATRRRVLGHAHVDRALAASTDFTQDFQALITRYAWGAIWRRPGLEERTRRLLVLATMAALGHWEEYRLHVSTGLMNGLEPSDIKEVLLQTAIYAGVPVANRAFQIAQEEMEKPKTDQSVSRNSAE